MKTRPDPSLNWTTFKPRLHIPFDLLCPAADCLNRLILPEA